MSEYVIVFFSPLQLEDDLQGGKFKLFSDAKLLYDTYIYLSTSAICFSVFLTVRSSVLCVCVYNYIQCL